MHKTLLVMAALFAAAASPVLALGPEDPNEIGVLAGHFRGDELTGVFRPPILEDDIAFGFYFVRHFDDHWSMMSRLSYVAGEIENLRDNRTVGADLTFVDLSIAYQWNWERFSLYIPVGVGYTWTSLERALRSPTGEVVRSQDEFGYHFGTGISVPIRDSLVLRAEGRYRIAGDLLEDVGDTADFYETTLGLGWTF